MGDSEISELCPALAVQFGDFCGAEEKARTEGGVGGGLQAAGEKRAVAEVGDVRDCVEGGRGKGIGLESGHGGEDRIDRILWANLGI